MLPLNKIAFLLDCRLLQKSPILSAASLSLFKIQIALSLYILCTFSWDCTPLGSLGKGVRGPQQRTHPAKTEMYARYFIKVILIAVFYRGVVLKVRDSKLPARFPA